MDHNRLSDQVLFIKQHIIPQQESLLDYLFKIEAMVEMLMVRDLMEDYTKSALHSYLCVLCDLITKAKDLNEAFIRQFNNPPLFIVSENAML